MLIKPLKKDCVFYSVFNCSFIHKRGGGLFSVSNPIKMQAHTDISIYVCLHERVFSNVEKITSAILPLAGNILYTPLPFRLFSNLFSVTMLALLLRISSKIAQKCRCKIAELILSTLLDKKFVLHVRQRFISATSV